MWVTPAGTVTLKCTQLQLTGSQGTKIANELHNAITQENSCVQFLPQLEILLNIFPDFQELFF